MLLSCILPGLAIENSGRSILHGENIPNTFEHQLLCQSFACVRFPFELRSLHDFSRQPREIS